MSSIHELYQPSLASKWRESKTFDINKFFIVGFFGGVTPLLVLGWKNADWLKVPRKKIYPIIAFGVVLVLAKALLLLAANGGMLQFNTSGLKLFYKFGCILIFFYLKFLLNKPYKQHLLTSGDTEPLLKTAIIWSLIGIGIEFSILASVSFL